MDRLTIRESASYDLIKMNNEWCVDYCKKQPIQTCRDCAIHEAIQKLAYYEDLEESYLLIKLPYPVGTPLFIPCRKQGVKQDHIRRWQTNNKGLMFCSNGSFYLADAIGKSVFLTREEADNKLKEMGK